MFPIIQEVVATGRLIARNYLTENDVVELKKLTKERIFEIQNIFSKKASKLSEMTGYRHTDIVRNLELGFEEIVSDRMGQKFVLALI